MKPPEQFHTSRLHLRPPILSDDKKIFNSYAQDKIVTRYLHWHKHESIEETRDFLIRCSRVWQEGTAFPWVINLKENSEMIGMIELRIDRHRADLGYVLARPYWDQGYGSEATRLVVQWTIAQPSIYRVWAVCDVDNHASARVLEKAGMQREGTLRRWLSHPNVEKEPRDCHIYAIVK